MGTATVPVCTPGQRLAWLTPARCRILLAALLVLGFLAHLVYLTNNCSLELVGDEAQYWDWSRQLELSYYSKGPLVAWLIRASCSLFGDNMPAVRLPALILAAGTSLCTYLLTARLFRSERLALGAVLLSALAPVFIIGSMLMTIDAPLFFCWGVATLLAALALLDNRRWPWPLIGIAVGLGFLAKYAMGLWLAGLFVFLLIDAPSRRWLRTPWPYAAVLIAALFTTPVILWNVQHNWASFRHVATQTGITPERASSALENLGQLLGAQAALLGPPLLILIVAAVVYAWRLPAADPHKRACKLLLSIGLTFLAINLLATFRTKVQGNWPAPAYFSLVILTAFFIQTRLDESTLWRKWRGIFWSAVALGLLCIPLLHHSHLLHPLLARANHAFGLKLADPAKPFRGWSILGQAVSGQLATMPPGSFVLCEEYQTTAQMAFHVAGQPKTFYAGSWFSDPKRFTQYDMWPDRALDQPALLGRDAIYIGWINDDIRAAFRRVEQLPPVIIEVNGLYVRTFRPWLCLGFKGMQRPQRQGGY